MEKTPLRSAIYRGCSCQGGALSLAKQSTVKLGGQFPFFVALMVPSSAGSCRVPICCWVDRRMAELPGLIHLTGVGAIFKVGGGGEGSCYGPLLISKWGEGAPPAPTPMHLRDRTHVTRTVTTVPLHPSPVFQIITVVFWKVGVRTNCQFPVVKARAVGGEIYHQLYCQLVEPGGEQDQTQKCLLG